MVGITLQGTNGIFAVIGDANDDYFSIGLQGDASDKGVGSG